MGGSVGRLACRREARFGALSEASREINLGGNGARGAKAPDRHGQNISHRLYYRVSWAVVYHDEFDPEFDALPREARLALLAATGLLEIYGPALGRPYVDTLKGSKHANMKELRFSADGGVWRAAFAFDPKRQAIVLVAGDKSGAAQARFYKTLIAKADRRFGEYLKAIRES